MSPFFWNVDINYALLNRKGKIQFLNFFWREILTLHWWEGLEPFGRARKGSILNVACTLYLRNFHFLGETLRSRAFDSWGSMTLSWFLGPPSILLYFGVGVIMMYTLKLAYYLITWLVNWQLGFPKFFGCVALRIFKDLLYRNGQGALKM